MRKTVLNRGIHTILGTVLSETVLSGDPLYLVKHAQKPRDYTCIRSKTFIQQSQTVFCLMIIDSKGIALYQDIRF